MFKLNVTTNQEAFDKVVEHLSTMPRRSIKDDTATGAYCLWAGPDGTRCAASILVDASWQEVKKLDNDRRGNSIKGFAVRGVIDIGDVNPDLVQDLQTLHDHSINWNDSGFIGITRLKRIGTEYGLDTSVVDRVFIEK